MGQGNTGDNANDGYPMVSHFSNNNLNMHHGMESVELNNISDDDDDYDDEEEDDDNDHGGDSHIKRRTLEEPRKKA